MANKEGTPKAGEVILGIPDPKRIEKSMRDYAITIANEQPAFRRFEMSPEDRARRLD